MMSDTATQLEDRLARSLGAPVPAARRSEIDARLSAAMGAESARRAGRTRFGLRRLTPLAVGLLMAAGLATAVGAATGVVRLEWGSLPQDQRTAAEINEEIAAAVKVVPVPPGYTFPPLSVPESGGVWGSYSGLTMVEFTAICAWYGDWATAFAAGNTERLARDRAMMDEILTWKTVADPFLADESVRDAVRRINAGADAGDPRPLESFRAANCAG